MCRRAVHGAHACRFEELCARTLGPADFIALSRAFHTLVLEGVPCMSMQAR